MRNIVGAVYGVTDGVTCCFSLTPTRVVLARLWPNHSIWGSQVTVLECLWSCYISSGLKEVVPEQFLTRLKGFSLLNKMANKFWNRNPRLSQHIYGPSWILLYHSNEHRVEILSVTFLPPLVMTISDSRCCAKPIVWNASDGSTRVVTSERRLESSSTARNYVLVLVVRLPNIHHFHSSCVFCPFESLHMGTSHSDSDAGCLSRQYTSKSRCRLKSSEDLTRL